MKFYVFFLILVFNTCACAAYEYTEEATNVRLDRIERDLNVLQQYFYKDSDGSYKNTYADDNRLDVLEEQIKYLTNFIEENNHKIKTDEQKLDNLKKDVEFRFTEIEKKLLDLSNQLKNITVKLKSNSKNVKTETKQDLNKIYDEAFANVKAKKYDQAEKTLKDFVTKYEKHQLSGNAYYWLGEVYMIKGKLEEAALNFLYSYKKFPKGSKSLDAMYKLSIVLDKLGKNKEACDAMLKIKNNYKTIPSHIKTNIEQRITKFNCKAK